MGFVVDTSFTAKLRSSIKTFTNLTPVEHGLRSLGKAGDVDAQVGGLLAVDRDGQLRLGGVLERRGWSNRGSLSISATIFEATPLSSV